MKNLILITSEFPYFNGEPFLENELPFLSYYFKEIYIFSINGVKSNKRREVPLNTECFALGDTVSKIKYARNIIRGIFTRNKDLCIKQYKPLQVIASLYTRGRAIRIADNIYSIIKKQRIHIENVVIYSFWFAYQAIAAWLLSEKLLENGSESISISRAHGYDLYWERVKSNYLPYQDVTLRKIKWCFPCSEYGRNYLLNKYPWASDKVITARLGTSDKGLNIFNQEKTFVTCCNLVSIKRMSLFAKAFCLIAKDDKQIKWICIGDGDEKTTIEKIVKDAGLKEQVVMTGRLSNTQVMEIYHNYGIKFFCNISVSEGLPVSIMEAMSFGIPILATNVGGTSELVDCKNGFLIDSNLDVESLVQYLLRAITLDNDNYLLLRKESRKKWEKLANAEKNYPEFCNLIQQ